MEAITIQKNELKDLIRQTITETIHKEFNKINYHFVSDKEQKELEKEFGKTPIFDKNEEIVKL